MNNIQVGDSLKVVNNKPLKHNDIAPPLVVGDTVNVKQTYLCKCGQDHIDVGLVSQYKYVRCYKCAKELPNGDTIHWCHPTRFEIVK